MRLIEKLAIRLPAGLVAGKKEVAKRSLAALGGAGLGYAAGRLHKPKEQKLRERLGKRKEEVAALKEYFAGK